MSPVVRLVVGLILVVVGCSSADAANRYDPRFRFRTITTPHFAIHFHQREESLARRLATMNSIVLGLSGKPATGAKGAMKTQDLRELHRTMQVWSF